MSTNFTVAVPRGDAWAGRYGHWSGSPEWMGPQLWAIVARDGLDVAQRIFTGNPGWSSIDAAAPSLEGVRANHKAPMGTPSSYKDTFNRTYKSFRYDWVVGYGPAMTSKWGRLNGERYQHIEPDYWITPDNIDDTCVEFVYVLTPGGLLVGNKTEFFGLYRWEDPEPDWKIVECGRDFERCGHMAYYHFDEAKGSNLATDAWLGRRQLTIRDCTELSYEGRRYKVSGGTRGGYGKMRWSSERNWYGYLRDIETGVSRDDIVIYHIDPASDDFVPAEGIEYHYPATAETSAP